MRRDIEGGSALVDCPESADENHVAAELVKALVPRSSEHSML
jgi:hypothetical protein